MKKLSLLMALLMFITVGGVYATWSYSIGGLTERHHYIGKIQMTDAISDGAKGAITVDYSTLSITIDDSDDDHRPELVITGAIVITYAPATDNPEPIDLYYHLGMSIPATEQHIPNPVEYLKFTYEEQTNAIFTTYDVDTHIINADDLHEEDNGTYTYTLNPTALAEMIKLDTTVVLENYQMYQAYSRALASVNYGIAVGEYVEIPHA